MKGKQKEEVKEESEWDKKKIILFAIAALVLLGIGFELKSYIAGDSQIPTLQKESVKGAQTEADNKLPSIKKGIQDQISSLQDQARNINLTEIASSSPQVQKVIKDLQTLKDLPQNQIKSTCMQICSGL